MRTIASVSYLCSFVLMIRIKGKRKTQDPCEVCLLHRERCICQHIPSLNLKTKISLVIHHKELKRTTNTGLLAARALQNSEVFIRGQIDSPLDLSPSLNCGYRSLLFYPSKDAVELTAELIAESPLPVQLIVPDGNWRQASKVHYRHPELQQITRVMIKTENTETQHLRKETTKEGMATLQAIAHALGIIEGDKVKNILLKLYKIKLEATLLGRGKLLA